MADLKKYTKNENAYKKLEESFQNLIARYRQARQEVELLECAIRNDYDSILITELNLELPGPKIVYVNDGFTRMTGYSKEEVIGKTPRILQGPKTDRAILDRLKRRLNEGQAFFGHTINYRKDGTEFINQWDIHPLFNADGEITHWVSYQRDVTDKKESAKAIFNTDFDDLLKRREEFTIKFTRDNNTGSTTIKFVNDAFEEITGIEMSKIFEAGIMDLIHADDLEKVNVALENTFKGKATTEVCRYKTAKGDYLPMLQSFKPVFSSSFNKVEAVKSVAKIELKES